MLELDLVVYAKLHMWFGVMNTAPPPDPPCYFTCRGWTVESRGFVLSYRGNEITSRLDGGALREISLGERRFEGMEVRWVAMFGFVLLDHAFRVTFAQLAHILARTYLNRTKKHTGPTRGKDIFREGRRGSREARKRERGKLEVQKLCYIQGSQGLLF